MNRMSMDAGLKKRWWSTRLRKTGAIFGGALLALGLATAFDFHDPLPAYRHVASDGARRNIVARDGTPLSTTYESRWNLHDVRPLAEFPEPLQRAFVMAEDQRFYSHHGVDIAARLHAVWQNMRAMRAVRGASTLTEQVVGMLDPRPRGLWSRWMEGFEAMRLESRLSKPEILEFYLNQVPYGHRWRGVVQASHGYFDRDPDTLSRREMLSLAVLVRSPVALDPGSGHTARLDKAIERLAARMGVAATGALALQAPPAPVEAPAFLRYVREQPDPGEDAATLRTTLDAGLQRKVQALLDRRVAALRPHHVTNGAVLVADHATGEILAWAVAGSNDGETPGRAIDAVRTPRQPGSAMKPFLYAAAFEKGWSPATLIDDSPLENAVGHGLHAFNNYSHRNYGPLTAREALGNSLNIPAVKTIRYVGVPAYLARLHRLGFESLDRSADTYDEGLALGNGEVTLFELVQAYGALADRGVMWPLHAILPAPEDVHPRTLYSPEAASLIGNILSDPWARQLEFGEGSVLNLPVQTAVKTGTSTDYRDAWAAGYDARYTVGVWMGNLDRSATDGTTGSTGPALVLRGIFAALHEQPTHPLYLSASLVARKVCLPLAARPQAGCSERLEYFMPDQPGVSKTAAAQERFRILLPSDGLEMAYDPRIPASAQVFPWKVAGLGEGGQVEWTLNGRPIESHGPDYAWPVARGHYDLKASALRADGSTATAEKVSFTVK